MALSEARETELKRWVYKVYDIHWKELAPKSNSRAKFLQYVIRDNFDNDKLLMIELGIKAQTKHWRKQNKIDRVIGIPTLSVWYNQSRYDDQFIDESASQMQDREQLKTCSVEACNDDVHGGLFSKCGFHLNSRDDALSKAFVATGLSMKSSTFVDDCRKLCKSGMRKMAERTMP